jgi:hypothetical protein
MTMEAQLYDDQPNPWLDKKKSMKLDLCSEPKKKSYTILSTPDVQMLKLASPELERLIMSQQGSIITTPTPTSILCPKNVTFEQEQFAEGFVQALTQLHESHPAAATTTAATAIPFTGNVTDVLSTNTTTSLPGSVLVTTSSAETCVTTSRRNHGAYNNYTGTIATIQRIKQEESPQTVPVFFTDGTPPTSPIDMEKQEKIKAQRKRLRNRIAASKCRKRKLERISRLEGKVDDLKTQNSDLTLTATQLREQVCKLKQQVMEHVKGGCQVMLAQQLDF